MDINQRREYLRGDELSAEGVIVRQRVSISEVWCECLRMPKGELTRYNSNEVMSLMRKIEGWEWHSKVKYAVPGYGSCKCFVRKNVTFGENQIDQTDDADIFT